MLTGVQDVEIQALRARGWSVSAIARHVGRDPKTVRDYLAGRRTPGVRKRSGPDLLERYVPYLRARFVEDPHVWATALYDELVALGYAQSYQTFTRRLRELGLRPHCEACAGVRGRATIEIEHPAGEEMQWDWDELPDAPWGRPAHLLLGTLPFSGRIRGCFADGEDQAYLVEALDGVLRRFGGTARRWRVDRMATVIVPGRADVQPTFVPVAKYYGVGVDPCPARAGNRKGSVEKSIHYVTQRWWRTARVGSRAQAQESLDRFCATTAERRLRPPARLGADAMTGTDGQLVRPTVADLAALETLLPLPAAPYPATLTTQVTVGRSALVAFDGNSYGVAPALVGAEVTVRHRLGTAIVEIVDATGTVLAEHRRQPGGAGVVSRSAEHRAALENVILAQFPKNRPCERKPNRPPGPAAQAEAARLVADLGGAVDVDLDAYQRLIEETSR